MSAPEFDWIAWAARETALRQCVGHIRPATATASASGEDQEKSTARTESTRDAEVRQ